MYSSKVNMLNTRDEINNALYDFGFNNSVIALDFTHFTEVNTSHKVYDLDFCIWADSFYLSILDEEVDSFGGYAYFMEKYTKIVCDLSINSLSKAPISNEIKRFSKEKCKLVNSFNPNDWHNALKRKNYGGCSIILSKRHGEAQSVVYIILREQLTHIPQEINYRTKDIKIKDKKVVECLDEIFFHAEGLLLDEMAHNLFTRQKALRDFKNKSSWFKHTIFNLFPASSRWLHTAFDLVNENKYDSVKYCLEKAINNFDVLDLCNRAIYEHFDNNNPLHKKTEIDIIYFLKEKHSIDNITPIIIDRTKNIELDNLNNRLNSEKLSLAFIVFWNFWHNATNRNKSNYFKVFIGIECNFLLITFKNSITKEMYHQANLAIQYLKGLIFIPPKIGGGIQISYEVMRRILDWEICKQRTLLEGNTFSVSIRIKI